MALRSPRLALVLLAASVLPAATSAAQAPPTLAPPVVFIVPLGRTDARVLRTMASAIEERFHVTTSIEPPRPLPPETYYPPRKRHRAEKLLSHLDALPLPTAHRVLGFTDAELSTTKGKHFDWGIAGLGNLGGKSCVVTTHLFRRFKTRARRLYLRYVENLVLHELGHTFGLDHCPSRRCIMADAKGSAVRAARASTNTFCARCTTALGSRLR